MNARSGQCELLQIYNEMYKHAKMRRKNEFSTEKRIPAQKLSTVDEDCGKTVGNVDNRTESQRL